jgi:hypothetical protein
MWPRRGRVWPRNCGAGAAAPWACAYASPPRQVCSATADAQFIRDLCRDTAVYGERFGSAGVRLVHVRLESEVQRRSKDDLLRRAEGRCVYARSSGRPRPASLRHGVEAGPRSAGGRVNVLKRCQVEGRRENGGRGRGAGLFSRGIAQGGPKTAKIKNDKFRPRDGRVHTACSRQWLAGHRCLPAHAWLARR